MSRSNQIAQIERLGHALGADPEIAFGFLIVTFAVGHGLVCVEVLLNRSDR
jgi:hypothetical protein